MTDFSLPVWVILSWLVKQIDNETFEEEPDEEGAYAI